MSLRSPLAQARGLGSAKSGVTHWWAQRWTALALVPLIIWFVVSVLAHVGADHATAVAWLSNPISAVLMLVLIVAGFHHAHLGLQVVIEDYVHAEPAKLASLLIVKGLALLLAFGSALAVLRIAVGGAA